MYDTLLDEFEDDAARTPDDDESFEKLSDDDDTSEDEECDLDDPGQQDDDPDVRGTDDDFLGAEDGESWSDDPVRMYLTQMGEIPLLTRQEEIRAGQADRGDPRRFRRKLLECDYVMQTALKVLQRVHDGELPFDRTVQVSVTDQLEKDQILGRLPHNLRTLEMLLQAEPARLPPRHQQVARDGAAPRGLAAAGPPPPPRRPPGRGTRSAHAADRADDQDARGVQPPRRSS